MEAKPDSTTLKESPKSSQPLKMTGGSASSTSSSGAPSSSSILADADEKEQFLQNQLIHSGLAGNQWMSMLLQQQQQNMQTEATSPTKAKAELSDMMQNPAAIMELLNGNGDLAKFAAQIAQNNKMNENDTEGQRDSSLILPPATSSVDSAGSSMIVNGHVAQQSSVDDDDISMQPSAKKQKTGEETPVKPRKSQEAGRTHCDKCTKSVRSDYYKNHMKTQHGISIEKEKTKSSAMIKSTGTDIKLKSPSKKAKCSICGLLGRHNIMMHFK